MNSVLSEKVSRQPSPIAGSGIFANQKIAKDEIIAIKSGSIISYSEFVSLGEFKSSVGGYVLQIADDIFIGPKNEDEIGKSNVGINHSCNGNVGFLVLEK